MRSRASLVGLLLLLPLASPAWAAKNWYDYYLDARDIHLPSRNWAAAVTNLNEAMRLKPEPALNVQTYGLQFIEYFPYYHLGLAHLGLGDHATALKMFNIEDNKGVIRKSPRAFSDLAKRRLEAQQGVNRVLEDDKAKQVRLLRDEVARLRKDSAERHRAGRFDDALALLAQAAKAAEALDPATQREIINERQKIRDDATRVQKEAEQVQRVARELAEGERLLAAGEITGATSHFDVVLLLEPQNVKAQEGKQKAEAAILASTTEAGRQDELRAGRAHFEAGRYEESLRPLTNAAADPRDAEAQRLLAAARKALEGMRKQKELRQRIDALLPEAERLLDERRYPEAMVRFESVLELDRTNVRAQERLRFAERMTTDEIFDRFRPNRPPALVFFEPRTVDAAPVEVEDRRVVVVGVATDDRGVARVWFTRGGRTIGEHTVAPDTQTGELARNVPFDREFDLDQGANEIKVLVTDSMGLATEQGFVVNRKLRPYEHAWFWPSAGGAAAGLMGLGYVAQRLRRRRAVRSRFNPYIAGAPVREQDMFFGRQKLLARILNVLHHNSLMITGERRIGKTSFLHHLKRALETDEGTEYQFFPVTTDLQGVPEESFFHAVMSDVVEGLRPKNLDALRFRQESEAYEGRDFSHDLQRMVEELATRTTRKVKLALLIDEVDVLNEYSERINQRLRSIFMKTFSEHLVAVMSGVGIKRIWKSEGSPWYNFFDEIELTAFSREEAEALIRQPVEGVFRYEPEAVERILSYSALKPYVIQKFCIHAVNRMLEEGRTTVTVGDVESVKDTVSLDGGDVAGDGLDDRRTGERRASA
jgi:tetratricopeptide (TPR) repeat protein